MSNLQISLKNELEDLHCKFFHIENIDDLHMNQKITLRTKYSTFYYILVSEFMMNLMEKFYVFTYFAEFIGVFILWQNFSDFFIRRILVNLIVLLICYYWIFIGKNRIQKFIMHQLIYCVANIIFMMFFGKFAQICKINIIDDLINCLIFIRSVPIFYFSALEFGIFLPKNKFKCLIFENLSSNIEDFSNKLQKYKITEYSKCLYYISYKKAKFLKIVGKIDGIYKNSSEILIFQKFCLSRINLSNLLIQDAFFPYLAKGFNFILHSKNYFYAISYKIPCIYQINVENLKTVCFSIKFIIQNLCDLIIFQNRFLVGILEYNNEKYIFILDFCDQEYEILHYKIPYNIKNAAFLPINESEILIGNYKNHYIVCKIYGNNEILFIRKPHISRSHKIKRKYKKSGEMIFVKE